jgi:hypothetical protein
MKSIAIIYHSHEGHTRFIAERIQLGVALALYGKNKALKENYRQDLRSHLFLQKVNSQRLFHFSPFVCNTV